MILFNWGRRNNLVWSHVVADDDFGRTVGWWLNGRLFGRYISYYLPWPVWRGK